MEFKTKQFILSLLIAIILASLSYFYVGGYWAFGGRGFPAPFIISSGGIAGIEPKTTFSIFGLIFDILFWYMIVSLVYFIIKKIKK